MKLRTSILGIPLASTNIDGEATLAVPQFTLLHFSGIRTRTKAKLLGITVAKTKGWLLTPFDVTSGPVGGQVNVDG